MEKIGIMTHHKFYNQGTMLQAYALQKKIEILGKDAEIINYTTETFRRPFKDKVMIILRRPNVVCEKIYKKYERIVYKKNIDLTLNAFNEFYSNIKISKERYSNIRELKEKCNKYDIYIVGSDQTWNLTIPSNKTTYLLDFVSKEKVKASYAPSIGGNEIEKDNRGLFKKYLGDFKCISCRENVGKDILSSILNREVEVVLDPTFLLSREYWDSISKEYDVNQEYLLCYFLGRNSQNINVAQKIAKEKNLKLISLYTIDAGSKMKKNLCFGVGPFQFLSLIKNARYICTDSFHGMIFSIIFKKEFYGFKKRKDVKKNDNNRIIDLLNKFNLEDRLIEDEKDLHYNNINYKMVDEILQRETKKSEEYLKKCIGVE